VPPAQAQHALKAAASGLGGSQAEEAGMAAEETAVLPADNKGLPACKGMLSPTTTLLAAAADTAEVAPKLLNAVGVVETAAKVEKEKDDDALGVQPVGAPDAMGGTKEQVDAAASEGKPPVRLDEDAGGWKENAAGAGEVVRIRLDEVADVGAKEKGDVVVLAKLKVGLLSPVPHGADAAAGAAADEAENNETGCVNENGDAAVQGVLAKLKVELTPPVPKGVDEAADAAATVEVAAGSAAACEVATVVVIGVLVGSLLPHNSLTTLKNRCFSSAAAFAAFSSASFSAVRPLLVVSERSVPASRSSSTQSSHALAAAIMRGVSPRSFWQFTSAFAASRSRMQAGRPSLASQCSAVLRKSALQYRTFAPLRRAS